jgi:sugar/nucleoside kinase (ribokinase family)
MSAKKFDFTVIGNAGIDTNIYLFGNEIDFSVEANFTENIDYIGQAGGYTSRGFAQLGYATAFIGYVGNDYNGRYIKQEFSRDGINTDAMFTDPAGTSRSINFMYPDGRRKNFYDGKSHMTLEPDLVKCTGILSKSKFVHFHIPNWARKLLPLAKDLDLTVSCDIQDIVSIDDPYRQDFINYSDIIFFSAANHGSPETIMRSILKIYPDKIIISGLGDRGCALCANGNIEYFEAVQLDEPVIDTNGAGDGLAVGFLSSYLLEKKSLNESVLRGQICARFTCSRKADTSSLITKKQLETYFNKMTT